MSTYNINLFFTPKNMFHKAWKTHTRFLVRYPQNRIIFKRSRAYSLYYLYTMSSVILNFAISGASIRLEKCFLNVINSTNRSTSYMYSSLFQRQYKYNTSASKSMVNSCDRVICILLENKCGGFGLWRSYRINIAQYLAHGYNKFIFLNNLSLHY